MNVSKQSLAKYVYETLKNAILSRQITPGQKLLESEISDVLGISRTPVRHAILELQKEGMVTIYPNKGAYVINPTIEEITEAFTHRKQLELIATENIMERITDRDIETLKLLTKNEIEAFEEKSLSKYIEINTNFHETLVNLSENRYLREHAKQMIQQTHIFLILYDHFYSVDTNKNRGPGEHQRMIEFIEKKDEKAFRELLEKHIVSTIDEYKNRINVYKKPSDLFSLDNTDRKPI